MTENMRIRDLFLLRKLSILHMSLLGKEIYIVCNMR